MNRIFSNSKNQVSSKKAVVIIPAAGSSSRMQLPQLKPFLKLNNLTVLQRTLDPFLKLPEAEKIIVLANPEHLAEYSDNINSSDPRISIIAGGKSRQESVCIGLEYFKELKQSEDTSDYTVIIHDAARCLITYEQIRQALTAAADKKAVSFALPVSDSLVSAAASESGVLLISKKTDRKNLYALQTPQAFSFDLIYSRHIYFKEQANFSFTDDTALLEGFHDVYLLEGSRNNIKITTKDDLALAEAIISLDKK